MTPAIGLFFGGMVDRKNLLSTIMPSFCTVLVVTIQWVLFGYSLALGPDFMHVIGKLIERKIRGASAPGMLFQFAGSGEVAIIVL